MDIKIAFNKNPEDPVHPFMHGDSPLAKEFNKRMKSLWLTGNNVFFEHKDKHAEEAFYQLKLIEILVDDYNKRNTPIKKTKVKK